jgi:transposase
MDNLGSHKRPGVRMAIEAAGANLLGPLPRPSEPDPKLPPYSPDFNPIEQAFAKLMVLLRKAAERSVAGLWTATGPML